MAKQVCQSLCHFEQLQADLGGSNHNAIFDLSNIPILIVNLFPLILIYLQTRREGCQIAHIVA